MGIEPGASDGTEQVVGEIPDAGLGAGAETPPAGPPASPVPSPASPVPAPASPAPAADGTDQVVGEIFDHVMDPSGGVAEAAPEAKGRAAARQLVDETLARPGLHSDAAAEAATVARLLDPANPDIIHLDEEVALGSLARAMSPQTPPAPMSDEVAQAVADAVASSVTGVSPTPPDPATPPGSAAGVTDEGLRTVAAMSTDAPALLRDIPAAGASYSARHSYNLALAGLAMLILAVIVGAVFVLTTPNGTPSASTGAPVAAASAPGPLSSASGWTSGSPDAGSMAPSADASQVASIPVAAGPRPLEGTVDLASMAAGSGMAADAFAQMVALNRVTVLLESVDGAPSATPTAELDLVIEIPGTMLWAIHSGVGSTLGISPPPMPAEWEDCVSMTELLGTFTGTRSGSEQVSIKGKGTVQSKPSMSGCEDTGANLRPSDPSEVPDVAWTATGDETALHGSITIPGKGTAKPMVLEFDVRRP